MRRSFHLFRKIRTLFGKEITAIQKRSYESFEYYKEMPKSKEYLSSDDSDSSVEKAPKRKREREDSKKSHSKSEKADSSKKMKSSSEDKEENTSWEIGNKRKVSVSEFKGKLYVNIREMYMDNNGELKPGKKGIALTIDQWHKLMDCAEEVTKAIKNK